jgi:Fic family protein
MHEVDLQTGGSVGAASKIINSSTREHYLVRSLIEEAFTSSQLEGASTTRMRAKELIRSGRKPHGRGEKMVLNNYRAMEHILELGDAALSKDLVCEIQRIVTEDTLDEPGQAGRFRTAAEHVVVGDSVGEAVYHVPPEARELEKRVEAMCDFANGSYEKIGFLHPALRAMILHFWLAYDHPFVDGNGRTARALFYWSMIRSGYWLFRYISISNIILKAPAQYGRAFLETETDDNDLTYFLIYHAKVVQRAIRSLHEYLERKDDEAGQLELRLKSHPTLNQRQRGVLAEALERPLETFTYLSHARSYGVVRQTARADLDELARLGLLVRFKRGRRFEFRAVPDLAEKLH